MEAAARREEASKNDVRRQVVTAYYAFAGSQLVLDSARRSLEASQAQLAQQEARTGAGVATDLERARAKAEVERGAQVVADAEASLANATRLLRTLTGLEARQTPTLPPDDLHEEPALDELEARIEGLPAVAAADRDLEVAGRNRHAALAAFAPTVNAQFTERLTNATGFSGQDSQWSAGVSFNWRLEVAGAYGLRVADANESVACLNAERARNVARDQVHSDWQRVRAGLTKVRAAQAQVQAARRAAELASDRYGAGVATQLDVIQADRDRFAAEVADVQARFELRLGAGLAPPERRPASGDRPVKTTEPLPQPGL
ncbi:MAG: TolC family protein [Myxococcales bacterium]